jgi:glutamate synthase (NADPH/NADH) large chain
MIEIVDLVSEDIAKLKTLVEAHATNTGSPKATALLTDWPAALKQFIRVQPIKPKPAPVAEAELAAAAK